MNALTLETRLTQLETQMQKRLERQNLLFELLFQQAQLQKAILGLALPNAQDNPAMLEAVEPLLSQYRVAYQQIAEQLPPDDPMREYVYSLQRLLSL